YVSLATVLFFYGGLSLFLSLVLPARRTAAMAAGVILLASYFVTTLARLDKGMEPVARFSPISYYQSGDAIQGLNRRWLAGALLLGRPGVGGLGRPDFRVGGRGGRRLAGVPSPPTSITSSPPSAMSLKGRPPRRASLEAAETGEAIVIGCA